MFKSVTPEGKFYDNTNIVIRKDKQDIARFCGKDILGQIDCDLVKAITTSYDPITREKTIIVEV